MEMVTWQIGDEEKVEVLNVFFFLPQSLILRVDLRLPSPHLAKQSWVFHTMCHAGFRWRGSWEAGTHLRLGRAQRRFGPGQSGCVLQALFCWFVLCIPLFCIFVVAVPFVCCSVKLPLSRPTGFCLFLSILLRTAAGGGVAVCHFCCRLQPKPKHQEKLRWGQKAGHRIIESWNGLCWKGLLKVI